MIIDLVEIHRLAEAKEVENLDFRRHLSGHQYPVEPLQALARDVREQIDCTTCANCCRYTVVDVGRSEIETIARYLGMEGDRNHGLLCRSWRLWWFRQWWRKQNNAPE